MEMLTGQCHICGEPVQLREATAAETDAAGYDPAPGEYFFGRCRKRYHADGSRTHYTQPTIVVHISETTER
jgi:hypothetical protein